jgi:hypothetical protein
MSSSPPPVPGKTRTFPLAPLLVLAGGALAIVAFFFLLRGGSPPAAPPAAPPPAPTPGAAQESTSVAPPPAQPAPIQEAQRPQGVQAPSPRTAPIANGTGQPPAPASPVAPPPVIDKTYRCREYADFDVSPEETIVTVDGTVIGKADDWDDAGGGKKYEFKGPGTHYVKLSLRRHETLWIKFEVDPRASEETAKVDLKLKEYER